MGKTGARTHIVAKGFATPSKLAVLSGEYFRQFAIFSRKIEQDWSEENTTTNDANGSRRKQEQGGRCSQDTHKDARVMSVAMKGWVEQEA